MKKEKTKIFLKTTGFLCVFLAVFVFFGEILTPKMLMESDWPTTTTYLGFYELEKDTVDAIFLGSSRGSTELLPQVMYNEYGIRAYNLSCQQQNMLTSYYWLKEALDYQKPKAVVLETDFLFARGVRSVLNSSEGSVRVAFNHMRWSKNKVKAIHDTCRLVPSLSEMSFYFPFVQYHSRWNELTEADFALKDMYATDGMMGYVLQKSKSGLEDYEPYELGTSTEKYELDPIMVEYLDKIRELCEAEHIALILTEGLTNDDTIEKYNAVNAYAEEYGLLYLNFNEKTLYEAVGADFGNDTYNTRHCNLWGGQKISKYIGGVLQKEYGLESVVDEQWEKAKSDYESAVQEASLPYITDIEEYLENLYNDRYTLFAAVQGNVTESLSEDARQLLAELGLDCNWEKMNQNGYGAVIAKGKKLAEKYSSATIDIKGSIRNNRVRYEIISGGKYCSVLLNQNEKAARKNGINLVVYDNLKKKVIDSVTLMTGSKTPVVYHNK